MSDAALHDPRAASLALLGGLIRRGRELRERSTQHSQNTQSQLGSADSAHSAVSPDIRIWQADCAAAVNELSGGSKAHWLSRAFSDALLVRSTTGDAVIEARVADIVARLLDVLEQARAALADLDTAAPVEVPAPHRFDFVHDPKLRPVLEQAFADSTRAMEEGDYESAMKTACGIIEAILTDALVRLKPDAPTEDDDDAAPGVVRGVRLQPDLQALSFTERIAAAEEAGLIRGGCARLPAAARAYRDPDEGAAITERDAKIARQVLHVVMRDLDPGR
jgi:hypothetical protein